MALGLRVLGFGALWVEGFSVFVVFGLGTGPCTSLNDLRLQPSFPLRSPLWVVNPLNPLNPEPSTLNSQAKTLNLKLPPFEAPHMSHCLNS